MMINGQISSAPQMMEAIQEMGTPAGAAAVILLEVLQEGHQIVPINNLEHMTLWLVENC